MKTKQTAAKADKVVKTVKPLTKEAAKKVAGGITKKQCEQAGGTWTGGSCTF